jgi:hypothetical protein
MGFNAKAAGFADVNTMITAMVGSEDDQLLAMANFLKHNRLDTPLRSHDWRSFARGYNGPNFEQNDYARKLEKAFAQYSEALPNLDVRAAQVFLTYLGFQPGAIDGIMGPNTRSALREFQQREGVSQTGNADPATLDKLRTKLV